MSLGYIWPQPGVFLSDAHFTKIATFGVFIASGPSITLSEFIQCVLGLLLEKGEAVKALSAKGSLLYGLTSILLLTPLAAPLLLQLPLQPIELVLGLAVFMLTPTTLSTGVTLIQALLSFFLRVFWIIRQRGRMSQWH